MPIPMLQSMSAKSGKSLEEVEKMWQEAKSKAKDKADTEEYYAYTTGILKSMLGLKEEENSAAVKIEGKKYKSIYEIPNIWVMNVVSNAIDEAAYDPETATLYVNFASSKSSTWFMYSNVPIKVFTEFTLSKSKGAYFVSKIKAKYEGTKIEG